MFLVSPSDCAVAGDDYDADAGLCWGCDSRPQHSVASQNIVLTDTHWHTTSSHLWSEINTGYLITTYDVDCNNDNVQS